MQKQAASSQNAGRLWEVDFARGAAVTAMVLFHAVFDLSFFAGVAINASEGALWWLARITAASFFLLVGIGLHLSFEKHKQHGFAFTVRYNAVRAAKTMAMALAITAATFFFLGNRGTIWFGALHLIAAAIIFCTPFLGRPKLALAAAGGSLALGLALPRIIVNTPVLLWLGLAPQGFYSFDYAPIFPWVAPVLFGIWVGFKLFPQGKRLPSVHAAISRPNNIIARVACTAGRHSLLVYFIHQPLLIAAILAAKALF